MGPEVFLAATDREYIRQARVAFWLAVVAVSVGLAVVVSGVVLVFLGFDITVSCVGSASGVLTTFLGKNILTFQAWTNDRLNALYLINLIRDKDKRDAAIVEHLKKLNTKRSSKP